MESESSLLKKRFIESSSFYINQSSPNPFSHMKISDSSFLNTLPARSPCPKCNKSRKYYCYNCYIAVKDLSSRLPIVKLPIHIDIIKHPKEVDGKSTSAHAAVLAPDYVKIYIYPDFPSYENEEVLLIFPGKSAVPFKNWWISKVESNINSFSTESSEEKAKNLPFSRVVFIDSTWRQSKTLYKDPRLRKLPCVVLSSYRSVFWRYYPGKHETHLSTIEAVYYFLLELHAFLNVAEPYSGQYDDMLFFFKFMYFKIRELYDPLKLKAYQN